MQQAYRVLRIVSEAQTIRIILVPDPGELMLKELSMACASLNTESSSGIKAIVLDFNPEAHQGARDMPITNETMQAYLAGKKPESKEPRRLPTVVEAALASIKGIAQPVLAVVRTTPSQAAWVLIQAADLTLVAHNAVLTVSNTEIDNETLNGLQAARLGYATWSVPGIDIHKEMERILDMLRDKSAIALRLTKTSTRLGQLAQSDQLPRLEALKRVNAFYLKEVMQTRDASEGLHAFLEKRKPHWKNV
jgi:enoyl-CoA hydratase/carnithine racemase